MLLKVLSVISLAALAVIGNFVLYEYTSSEKVTTPIFSSKPSQVPESVKEESPPPMPATEPVKPKTETSSTGTKTININFYSQAPFGVWDPLHSDACEEATLLMLDYWRKGEKPSLETYDEKLKSFVGWQTEKGYGVDVNVNETKEVASGYLNLPLTIKEVNSADDMKALIDAGKPFVYPADGKRLKNPNFRDGGPVYHMLVVIGYDGDTFIVNDPGTKRGAGYRYSATTLMDALGDWTGSGVDRSSNRVLVFEQ